MNDEKFRELLVLRLYGETSPEEDRDLEKALAASESLRRFNAGLECDLGRIVREAGARGDPDLPPDWRMRLEREGTRIARRRSLRLPLAAAVAGFAAGAGLMWVLAGKSAPPAPAGPVRVSAYERDTPAPPARVKGRLRRIGEFLH